MSVPRSFVPLALFTLIAHAVACTDDAGDAPTNPGGDGEISLGGTDAGSPDAAPEDRGRVDGGFATAHGVLREDRFVTEVVSFQPGACAGFGAEAMPDVVFGPPLGAGDGRGGLDVVSLGVGGEIVLAFGDNAIVDGPGPDFIVFENAFFAAFDPSRPAADLAEVSVSDDGETWATFPCTPGDAAPYGTCAGWRPVYSAPGNGISPLAAEAGGDPFDLATLGVATARFVRIRDHGVGACDARAPATTAGFDLDAIAITNALLP